MTALPAFVVAALCGIFACLVGRQYRRHKRLPHLFWGVSLAASAGASLAYCLTIWTTPHSPVAFVVYYLLGALWMPAIMGLGSVSLIAGRRTTVGLSLVVAAVGLAASVMLIAQPVDRQLLDSLDGGAGTGIIRTGSWLFPLIVLNSFGAAAVIWVALVSAWRTVRKRAPKRFLYGNLALAAGIVVIAAAGSAARLGWPTLFWLVMLVGWAITFGGYVLLTPSVYAQTEAQLART